jgi:hypothetical protein
MKETHIRIELKCKKPNCGGTIFQVPETKADGDNIVCIKCGTVMGKKQALKDFFSDDPYSSPLRTHATEVPDLNAKPKSATRKTIGDEW